MLNVSGKAHLAPLLLGSVCTLLAIEKSYDVYQWSTVFSSLASDGGVFWVILLVMIGFLWRGTWKSAVSWKSNAGTLVFLSLYLTVLNKLAYNEAVQLLDSSFAFCVWLLLSSSADGISLFVAACEK